MKTTRKLFILAVSFLAAVFVSCNDGIGNVERDFNNGNSVTAKQTRMLTGVVTNLGEYVTPSQMQTANESARTIMPDPITNTSDYDFYLYGKSYTEVEFTMTKLEDDTAITFSTDPGKELEGSFKIPVPMGSWEFVLVAVKQGSSAPTVNDWRSKGLLYGEAAADLSKIDPASPVNFTLSPDGLTGNGSVVFDVYFTDDNKASTWWNSSLGYTISAEIQNLITGEVYASSTKTLTPAGTAPTIKAPYTMTTDTNTPNVTPGTYNFVVTFKKGTKVVGTWSDILVVISGRIVNQDVLIPNIIGKKPENVTTLNAAYIADSENKAERPEDYKVFFSWDASTVNNEKYFELQIADVTGVITTTDTYTDVAAAPWDASSLGLVTRYAPIADNSVTDEEILSFTSSKVKVNGSLVANNKSLTMYLPLGKAYTARIRAVNDVGESDWTYLTIPKDAAGAITPAINPPSGTGTVAYFAYGTTATAATTINRYMITYHLNGGSYSDKSTEKVVYGMVGKISAPATTVKALWAADKDSLKKGDTNFTYWYPVAPNSLSTTDRPNRRVYQATKGCLDQSTYANFKKTTTDLTDAALTTAAAVEAADDGGYIGIGNVELWADYTTDFAPTVEIVDPAKVYFMYTDWIQYKTSKDSTQKYAGTNTTTAPTTKSSTCALTISKDAAKDGSEALITCQVTVPTAAGLKTNFKTITMSVTDRSGTHMITPQTKAASTTNTATEFRGFDIKDWDIGKYTVTFTGVIDDNGQEHYRQASVIMDITD